MHDCIIGRNTIEMIPSLHASLTNIRRDILMFAQEIDELEHDLIRDLRVNQTDNQQSTAEEGAIIIFPGFRDSRPPIDMSKEVCPPERPEETAPNATTSAEVESTRTLIEQELESVTTDSAKDINLSQNQHLEFRIHLRDPNQKAIRCKARPLPEAIKTMVKEALTQQLEAGLIRRSTSEWASPLHVVIKPDGTIRLTVDYKILNAAIEFDAYSMPNTQKLLQEITQSK
jgi:hypothetical protein